MPDAEIIIRNVNGQITIAGTVPDKLVGLGMLEMAKMLIIQQPEPAAPAVEVPPPNVARHLVNGHRG